MLEFFKKTGLSLSAVASLMKHEISLERVREHEAHQCNVHY